MEKSAMSINQADWHFHRKLAIQNTLIMIRKLLALLSLLALILLQANAQCTPDTSMHNPGIFPDTATNLPFAVATVPYGAVITFVVPHDTNIGGFIIPIDSIGVAGMTGLPAGFNYYPSTPSGYWRGDSSGCVLIQGMPLQSQVGTHPFSVSVIGKAGGLTVPATVTGYRIVIKDSSYASIADPSALNGLRVYPNPSSESLRVAFSDHQGGMLYVFNALGQLMESAVVSRDQLLLDINTSSYPEGTYMVSFLSAERHFSRNFIVRH
jgi:hypothetical protein